MGKPVSFYMLEADLELRSLGQTMNWLFGIMKELQKLFSITFVHGSVSAVLS